MFLQLHRAGEFRRVNRDDGRSDRGAGQDDRIRADNPADPRPNRRDWRNWARACLGLSSEGSSSSRTQRADAAGNGPDDDASGATADVQRAPAGDTEGRVYSGPERRKKSRNARAESHHIRARFEAALKDAEHLAEELDRQATVAARLRDAFEGMADGLDPK